MSPFSAQYSWVHALLGGVLIGLGSLLAAGASGKIPGISGMFSRVLRPRSGDAAWRFVFFAGLLFGAALTFFSFEPSTGYIPVSSLAGTLVAGLLVGLGTRLGGGCTSGHGVCGLGLGSKSAFIATLVFIGSGMLVVFLAHHGFLGAFAR